MFCGNIFAFKISYSISGRMFYIMENYYRFLVLFGLAAILLQCVHGEMDMQKLLTIASECKTIEKATELDFVNLKMNVKPKTRPMKCLTACLMEKVGKITNRKFNSQDEIKNVEKSTKIPSRMQKTLTEIVTECANIMEPDRCEYASKIADCLMAGAAKRGIKSQRGGF
ncbi:general odorant-binding protein 56h-like [Bradysia coprophila]|uniref:general odorant-binding protein 56h-like n=1 Tax=Bradysia coprophila TaxID=38358 RepID=UPI00187D7A51|nr:general odorant-binding protein 56h-like [Bradysia coprophila]